MSGLVILVEPIPLDPKRGFNMMSPPSSWKHLRASSGDSVTAVRGTGNPFSWKRVREQYLSTACSMASGGLTMKSPARSSLRRRFILKNISSMVPSPIGRVIRASSSLRRLIFFTEASGV